MKIDILKNVVLNEEQKKHVESFIWLLDGERPSGRTYLLALVYIDLAEKNRGQKIKVRDHYPLHDADRNLCFVIKTIIESSLVRVFVKGKKEPVKLIDCFEFGEDWFLLKEDKKESHKKPCGFFDMRDPYYGGGSYKSDDEERRG